MCVAMSACIAIISLPMVMPMLDSNHYMTVTPRTYQSKWWTKSTSVCGQHGKDPGKQKGQRAVGDKVTRVQFNSFILKSKETLYFPR